MNIQTPITLRGFAPRSLAAIKRDAKKYGVNSLLGKGDANPKIAKNEKDKAITFPLNLAPAKESKLIDVCPWRTDGCTLACLNTAGNPLHLPAKLQARINRTILFALNRELFFEMLRAEIDAAFKSVERRSIKDNETYSTAFRLNTTSDLVYEKLGRGSQAFGKQSVIDYILQRGGVPYDYTKGANRKPPRGYHLTFSLAENNDADALQFLQNKTGSVAIVFDTKKNRELPKRYPINGVWFDVIDGDLSDYRVNDPIGVLIGLRAKGQAIGDKSGFVRPAAMGAF